MKMKHSNNETLMIAWCDNGLVDGKFANGLLTSAFSSGVPVNYITRIHGNQIARQRQEVFNHWADEIKTDWLFWIDSDIVLTTKTFKKIWELADKNNKPIVTGVYFLGKDGEVSLTQPMPSIYLDHEGSLDIHNVHPLPVDEIIKIDYAGFGLVLMHKSIIDKVRKVSDGYSLFLEDHTEETFLGEDISFFKKIKKANIPVYADTSAVAEHIKRFPIDINYYNLYWNSINK
jgi:hypothetical protein